MVRTVKGVFTTLAVLVLLGFGSTAMADLTDTEWEIDLNASNWVPGIGNNGFWGSNSESYTMAFGEDTFTLDDADDTEVLSVDYEESDGFWNRLTLDIDSDQLTTFIEGQIAGLLGEGQSFEQDSLEITDTKSWSSSSSM